MLTKSILNMMLLSYVSHSMWDGNCHFLKMHDLLKLPDEQRDAALECFNNYIQLCPAAQSVIGCIDISHNLELEKKED